MTAHVSSGVADVGVGDFIVSNERSEMVEFADTLEFKR
jgi:hypothetical protein